ncbi:hypothetical protein JR316_0001091 [Psilocybe cubensis]|uniref:Uncharacterized protein n=2 Tax=Psilocybe cubensis TaxID=181762 RepID=A0ACB8HI95_PSICU|nr:hypothetical protein JR316_0001091 [Psilocybe cubensis]KAH9487025.1 hypothetical protein JR316_0001091 [Psilocybe cubensis]
MPFNSHPSDNDDEAARVAAAIMIQRLWRGSHNLTKERHLNADARWDDAATGAKLAVRHVLAPVHRNAALDESTTPRQRWNRAAFFITQLKFKNELLSNNGVQVEAEEKHLEAQHWLEMIDGCVYLSGNLGA